MNQRATLPGPIPSDPVLRPLYQTIADHIEIEFAQMREIHKDIPERFLRWRLNRLVWEGWVVQEGVWFWLKKVRR